MRKRHSPEPRGPSLTLIVVASVGFLVILQFMVAHRAHTKSEPTAHRMVTPAIPDSHPPSVSTMRPISTLSPKVSRPYQRPEHTTGHKDASHIGVVKPYMGSKNYGNPIKVDLRVYMNDEWIPERPMRELSYGEVEEPLGEWKGPTTFLRTQRRLIAHPWTRLQSGNETVQIGDTHIPLSKDVQMEAAMLYIKSQPQCKHKPIFMTMASVGNDLYWQLVENFVYTMAKFEMSDCSIVVCMSDPMCMQMCSDWNFPCFDWTYEKHYPDTPRPSMMEQIAILKLRHLPKALKAGVDVFMLDLDVGFLATPQPLVDVFNDPVNKGVDVFVQEDMIFIMNRTKIGWKTWFTEPLPNIGLFLARGNDRTASIFHRAWETYDRFATPRARTQPGKDQNHVLGAMRELRARRKLKYAYFANNTALLLDKIYTWQHNRSVELGGQTAEGILHGQKAVAVHTTCYENTVKLWALKAANAYWNPRYYDPVRPTITKTLYFTQSKRVEQEMRALVWLGVATGRSIILPNLIGPPQRKRFLEHNYKEELVWPPERVPAGVRASHYIRPGAFMKFFMHGAAPMWPGFRLLKVDENKLKLKALGVTLLEHGFYWRVHRNYDDVPPVTLVSYVEGLSLDKVREKVLASGTLQSAPRVVLHACPSHLSQSDCEAQGHIVRAWANCSIGQLVHERTPEAWARFAYAALPGLDSVTGQYVGTVVDVTAGSRACKNIFGPLGGNRTCFGKCR